MAEIERLDALGFRAWHGRAQPMGVEHTHGDVEINLSPVAALQYRIGSGEAIIPAGRLGLLWGAIPHQLLAAGDDPNEASYWVTIPLDRLLRWDIPAAFIRDLLAGRLLVDRASSAALDVLLLRGWAMDLAAAPDGRPDRTVELEVEARLRRMALRHGWDASGGRPLPMGLGAMDVGPIERMARFMVDHHAEPITVDDVASAVSWHPNYAMTRFKEATGMTLMTYLTRQRVAHAQRLLVTTEAPVLDVAFEAGFGAPSRFYAAFRSVTGRTPAAYRRAMRGP